MDSVEIDEKEIEKSRNEQKAQKIKEVQEILGNDEELREFIIQFIKCDVHQKDGECEGCDADADAIIDRIVEDAIETLDKIIQKGD